MVPAVKMMPCNTPAIGQQQAQQIVLTCLQMLWSGVLRVMRCLRIPARWNKPPECDLGGVLQAHRVHSAANDTPQRVPGAVIEPVPQVVEALLQVHRPNDVTGVKLLETGSSMIL